MITLTDRFERIFDLGKFSTSFDVPAPAPIQRGEYITFSKLAPKGLTPGEIYKVDHVEAIDRDWSGLYWKAEVYVNTGIKTPSGWQNRGCVLVTVHKRGGSFQFGRAYEFLGIHGAWELKKRIEEYLEAEKTAFDMGFEELSKMTNPHEEDSPAYIGWLHAWGFLQEEEEEEEDFDIDPEYEHNHRMVEELSCHPDGLTGSEARDILYDY